MFPIITKISSRIFDRRRPNKLSRLVHNRSWRVYGNTQGRLVNQLYQAYTLSCRRAYQATGNAIDVAKSPIMDKGAIRIEGALASRIAHEMSDIFTGMIERGEGLETPSNYTQLMTGLARPVSDLGEQMLDIFDNPVLDEALRGYFGSYYRLQCIDCYRTHPTPDVRGSWMWHIDDVPPPVLKVMLHLTDAGVDQGATRFISPSHTRAYGLKGYLGLHSDSRTDDLEPFARKTGVPVEPFYHEAKAGDALIFDSNLLHRAIPPSTGYRDVATFIVLPNPIPWREQLELDGLERLQSITKDWPADPQPLSTLPNIKL